MSSTRLLSPVTWPVRTDTCRDTTGNSAKAVAAKQTTTTIRKPSFKWIRRNGLAIKVSPEEYDKHMAAGGVTPTLNQARKLANLKGVKTS